jgi:hypothetical protein
MSVAAPTPQQRAEVLRVRLRMAMFRVRTNQLRVPLDGLLLPDLAVQQPQQDGQGQRQEDGSARREPGATPRSPITPLCARHTAATEDASTTGTGGSPGADVDGCAVGAVLGS